MPRRCSSSSHLPVEMATVFYSVARPSFFFHLDSQPSSPPKPSISVSSLRSPFSSPPIARRSTMRSFSIFTRASSSLSSSSAALDGFNVGSFLSVTILGAANGEPVQFNDLLDEKDGIVVVALMRHFGCICCWELASTLRDVKPQFDSAGVKLIAVGVGTPDKARMLAERLPFPLDCLYADPDRKAYDTMELYFGLARTFFNPASAKVFSRLGSMRNAFKNYTISATPDDRSSVLQQGGMFIFKGKQLIYARKDEGTGDHAPLEDVLNLCCKAPVA